MDPSNSKLPEDHVYLKMFLAALAINATTSVFCQVAPQAARQSLPLTVGVGYSNYASDWNGRLQGPTLWVDWSFYQGPRVLRGFGIEVEGRDLNYGRTGTDPKLRMYTAGGGPTYTWRGDRKFRPYARFLVSYAGIDFNIQAPSYTHDSRTVYAPGAGLDYRVFRNVSMRVSYEYQFWPNFFNQHSLNPQGLTIGAAYKIGRSYRD
jgi:opacity protein-like surface antigen